MDLRYPIGAFQFDGELTSELMGEWIGDIEELPQLLRAAVNNLTDEQLDTPYRPEGWTVRQVVHHLADSHMNVYIRFKWAITEENPLIKAYDEQRWAELADNHMPLESSLALIESLHIRWAYFLRQLTVEELEKTFIHPESGEQVIGRTIGNYAWHGKHHLAHITVLMERHGW